MSERRRPPEDQAVFFIDRSLGAEVIPSALRLAGFNVRVHDDLFGQKEPDHG